jgi:hypothetical protein
MTKHTRTKLVPLEVRHEEQSLETEEVSQQDQSELPMSELDIEIECLSVMPRIHGTILKLR